MSFNTEIICTGRELLTGRTLNTNAHFLAKRITELGGNVRRIVIVGDDVEDISSAVKEAIERGSDVIILTGGLGPTFDDKTLQGISNSLGKALTLNKEALAMLKEKYKECELSPSKAKMALLPEGSKPISNPVGEAPGVIIEHGRTKIIALPGPPIEMKTMFEESITPILKEMSKLSYYEESIEVYGLLEADLSPIIDMVMKQCPRVYIKSHPKENKRVELSLSIFEEDRAKAIDEIKSSISLLSRLIEDTGGRISKKCTQYSS